MLHPEELWKDIRGYKGYYRVSNYGRVQRVRSGSNTSVGKILKPILQTNGYVTVSLCKQGKSKHHYIHVLVCEAFHGPKPSSNHEVNHKGKDGDRENNTEWNLEWVTDSEQQIHRFNVLNKRIPSGENSKLSKTYTLISPSGKVFKIKGLVAFCKSRGLFAGALINVAKGRNSHHKGWKCSYGH